jgi:hypothetical protein
MSEGTGRYHTFATMMDEIRGAHQQELTDSLRHISMNPKNPKSVDAICYLLERMYPKEFGQTQRVTIAVEQELAGLLDRFRENLPPDQYARVMQIIAEAG